MSSDLDADLKIDHIAIAVLSLETAVPYFENLGFAIHERRETTGETTSMKSVVMKRGGVTFVLLEGGGGKSQVSRFLETYGPGLHHIALHVNGLPGLVDELKGRDVMFSTGVVHTPGLTQAFLERDEKSSIMIELIERTGDRDFEDKNVAGLFRDLEQSGKI